MKHYTVDELKEAMKGSRGNLSMVAKRLNCSWETARKYVSNNDELRQTFKAETDSILDKAESIIAEALDNEQDKKTQLETAKWILNTKGYSRGYNVKGKHYERQNALEPLEGLRVGNTPDD